MPIDPFDSTHFTKNFPDSTLLDIARNGSAQHDYRLFAVEILHARKSPKLQHPEIQGLVRELEIELEGIVFEHPAPGPGALTASVTTETLQGIETIDMDKLRGTEILVDAVTDDSIFTGFAFDISPTEPVPIPAKPNPKEPIDATE
jgi:hypothetical protein